MTRSGQTIDDDAVAETAAGWFVRLQGEDVSADEWLAFERWLAAEPAHALAYAKLEALSVELDLMAAPLSEALKQPKAASRRGLPRHAERRPTRRAWVAGGGAIAASLALGAVILSQQDAGHAVLNTYRTAPGQTRAVKLADGTQVRMNAASTLNVRFERDARRVEMADAEASFDVTHDAKRPFLISAGDTQIRVVGTEFNVRRRDGETELTVRRGIVEVRPGGADAAPVRVAAGRQFTHRDGSPQAVLTEVNASDAFAWTAGQLVYRDRPLSEVVADLSRRFGRSITTADARTGAIRFTGVLVTDTEPAVIRRLESFAPVKAEITPSGVILHGR